ncbi:hypothetical protein [Hoeflea sp.]|uniref:hypothetical protein n=1 Tax=Hoeflea sp. TaxID=1940281 RepID=UPI003B0198C6
MPKGFRRARVRLSIAVKISDSLTRSAQLFRSTINVPVSDFPPQNRYRSLSGVRASSSAGHWFCVPYSLNFTHTTIFAIFHRAGIGIVTLKSLYRSDSDAHSVAGMRRARGNLTAQKPLLALITALPAWKVDRMRVPVA